MTQPFNLDDALAPAAHDGGFAICSNCHEVHPVHFGPMEDWIAATWMCHECIFAVAREQDPRGYYPLGLPVPDVNWEGAIRG